jgi:peptide deformylase
VSVKPVRLFIDPILSQPTELITDFPISEELAGDMIETMLSYRGVGLSANQIGVNKNLAVLYLENKTKIIVVAGIKIIGYTNETDIKDEGCLSCPGVVVPMKRSLAVRIEGQRLSGEKVNLEFEGFDARILQHEFDHLCGKLIINNLLKL